MLILILLLVGCATGRVTDHCAGWRPIYPSKADVLTDGTSKQILGHDEYGVKSKCWKAPAKAKAKP
jgi:hypothetical protein